jgi:hypothetical protein
MVIGTLAELLLNIHIEGGPIFRAEARQFIT